jgi:Domain of unknown function (DUF5668)
MQGPTSLQPSTWLHREEPAGDERVLDLGRLLLGAIVVALGILFLLDAAGVLNADKAIDQWWPIVILAAGVLTLAERPPSLVRGTVLTGAGVVLLLFTTDLLEEDAWDYVWPALLGLLIIARWHGRTIVGANGDDVIRSTAFFGGPKLASTSRSFRGAWLTAVFGGITLDLRDAALSPEGASIDKTDHSRQLPADAPTLHVDALTVLGGVDIKHKK